MSPNMTWGGVMFLVAGSGSRAHTGLFAHNLEVIIYTIMERNHLNHVIKWLKSQFTKLQMHVQACSSLHVSASSRCLVCAADSHAAIRVLISAAVHHPVSLSGTLPLQLPDSPSFASVPFSLNAVTPCFQYDCICMPRPATLSV